MTNYINNNSPLANLVLNFFIPLKPHCTDETYRRFGDLRMAVHHGNQFQRNVNFGSSVELVFPRVGTFLELVYTRD